MLKGVGNKEIQILMLASEVIGNYGALVAIIFTKSQLLRWMGPFWGLFALVSCEIWESCISLGKLSFELKKR